MSAELPELEPWLGFCELNRGLSKSTVYNYRHALKHYAIWLGEQKLEVRHAQPELVQRYAGEVLHSRGQSPATRRVAVSALRGYYRWLEEKRLIARSPAAALPFPRMGRKLPLPIGADDASKLMAEVDLHTFKGVRDLAILSVLLGCGPRVSGVCNLNEGDLIFNRTPEGIEELTLRLTEKGKHERYVPAPEEARLMLRAYLGHPELELVDRRLPDGDQVLFVNIFNSHVPAPERRGEARRLTEWSVLKMVQTYGLEAGINPKLLHPHAFRHFYGQELAEHETHILVMQQLMGHASAKSSELYSHIAFRKIREAAMKANPMKRVKHPASGLAQWVKAEIGK